MGTQCIAIEGQEKTIAGRPPAGIAWSAVLHKLAGGLLALSSWAVWTLSPASAGRRIVLVVIPLVWLASKLWCRGHILETDLPGARSSSRNWKMGLTAVAVSVSVLGWYVWSVVWLSGVPHLATAPLIWRLLVYFSGLLHQSILPWSLLALITGFPLMVWFFGDSWLELFLGITTTLTAWDAVTGSVHARSAWNLVVLLCALLFILRAVIELRADWAMRRRPAASSPLITSPLRNPGERGARAAKQFCSSSVEV